MRNDRGPIICLEGPPAVGKTTLAHALTLAMGARVVPELVAKDAPQPSQGEPWFTSRHVALWEQATALAVAAPLVVLDGDPWKGLWYNWLHADEGWPGGDVTGPLLDSAIAAGRLSMPDLSIILLADVETLRQRRASDPARRRRNHERHLARLEGFIAYMEMLSQHAPSRVLLLPAGPADGVLEAVLQRLRSGVVPVERDEARDVLAKVMKWVSQRSGGRVPGLPDAQDT